MISNLRFLISIACIAMVLFSTSCSKDDDNNNNADLLTSTAWKLVAGNLGGLDEELDDCDLDDRYNYQSNGTYLYDGGAEMCFSDDPEEITGTWELKDDGSKIRIVAGGDDLTADIIELNESRFIWEADTFFGRLRQEFEAAN